MCINKKQILNRKYTMNKKNGGNVPVLRDKRQEYVKVPCGQCYVCRKKKAREWRMRLTEDVKVNKDAKIVLLTFNTESLKKLTKRCGSMTGYELDNEICRQAVKLFRERWRKEYGRSLRHWFITELGHGKTEHVHMHGIVWKDSRYNLKGEFLDEVERIWKYGFVGRGKKDWKTGKYENYVNAKTANYFTKYVNKVDGMHKEYKQIILTSAGIGKAFLESEKAKDNRYRGKDTNQMYNVDNGGVLPMPEYFRRKMYNDDEREKLTGWMLDENVIYIEGKPVRNDIGDDKLNAIYTTLREKNARMGYGDGRKNYQRKMEENARRRDIQRKRGIYGAGYRSGEIRGMNPKDRTKGKRT